MWNRRLLTVLGLSTLCWGLALMPANAGSSRSMSFLFSCDGTNKRVVLSLSEFPPLTGQFVVGGEVTLFENHGGLQYVIVRANGDPLKQVLTLGQSDNSARFALPASYPVFANSVGAFPVTIDGACNGGFGQVQGMATIYFN